METKVGDKYEKGFYITEEMVYNFAKSIGDTNPIHLDDNFAQKTVFKKRIAHGSLIASLISTVLGNFYPGPGTVYMSQSIKFRKPVYFDDLVKVIIEVVEITELHWLKLRTTCRNQEDILIIEGEALVIPPEVGKIT